MCVWSGLIILVFCYFLNKYLTNREDAKGAKEEKEVKQEFSVLLVAQASCL
ncbi:hypothetical protein AVDCRST_MAG84-7003 [uncultured Microcoleus sp.]|uniref:Uncharacterized protein n=1 Tax=uncultured Microcoleus sp. TaxID=259945 RepID=A0A6J4PSC8_9CYAN|nr:hypothetical protein AVDCRST_MAG84-7003 [uncultured Microcoleus sp.]